VIELIHCFKQLIVNLTIMATAYATIQFLILLVIKNIKRKTLVESLKCDFKGFLLVEMCGIATTLALIGFTCLIYGIERIGLVKGGTK